MGKLSLEARLLSDDNIYLAINMVNSYILNKELLSPTDRETMRELTDPFNVVLINKQITTIQKRLHRMLTEDDDLFEISVYFKPKKYENNYVLFRPLHTAALIDQITMVAMLQILVFQEGNNRKLIASELSRLLPASFFGNRVSYDGRQLFRPWQEQYHIYTDRANECLSIYAKTCEYSYEVDLDIQDFFPSVQPEILYSFIISKLPLTLDEDDQTTMRKIIRKLLLFRI